MKEDILHMKEHNYSFKPIFKGHWVKTASVALLVIKGGMLQSLLCDQHAFPHNTYLNLSL